MSLTKSCRQAITKWRGQARVTREQLGEDL